MDIISHCWNICYILGIIIIIYIFKNIKNFLIHNFYIEKMRIKCLKQIFYNFANNYKNLHKVIWSIFNIKTSFFLFIKKNIININLGH